MPSPAISIVVPTYQEVQNLPILVERIATALQEYQYEIIIADDFSADGTDELCAQLAEKLPVRLLSRHENRGLSPAVMDGIDIAKGEWIVVMDADLSHPPEKIPELIEILKNNIADFVVGSRYAAGGELGGDWPLLRRINSWVATILAKPLTSVADPMSGFFAFHRHQMPTDLSPIGYKIGLEILVKAKHARTRVCETPIFFGDRCHGESKMIFREQVNYLRHLRRLYHFCWPKRMEIFQFGVVGGVGFVVDVIFYYLLQMAGITHLFARAIAFWPSVTSNWFFNRIMTFKTRPKKMAAAQWMQFVATSLIGFCINWGVYATLTLQTEFFMENKFVAFVLGVLVGAVFNFIVADKLVFTAKQTK